jgi:acetyl-CoA carboxylase biotin carboxylase subunit
MFKTVLVANRGEIALRIIEVLNENGIASVAVYSEADADALHTKAATHAACIGPAMVKDSYLNAERILEVASTFNVDAIHPGYGLLSENATFARACAQAGVVFIGPSPEVIEKMGDKASARFAAEKAGVPVVPGSNGVVQSVEEAERIAESLGYPVLIKASGGGGGIGMALVKKPTKLARAFQSCQDRGASSFGNADVYMEKYIESPRHIEVQVLGDNHGHLVHLFERECTLQRRHQKVVEEAPSRFVSEQIGMRERLCEAAVTLAKQVNYQNAGTIEFIADQNGSFYFIEMNTRLQVEHPVTEMITQTDIISWQLRIAANERLTLDQADVKAQGHAIECRLYAEDPTNRFFPKPGEIEVFEYPKEEGMRVDAAFEAPATVTPYYDPMIAKLSVYAQDRTTAISRMKALLEGTTIRPLTTNKDFLLQVMNAGDYEQNQVDTTWLERFAKSLST